MVAGIKPYDVERFEHLLRWNGARGSNNQLFYWLLCCRCLNDYDMALSSLAPNKYTGHAVSYSDNQDFVSVVLSDGLGGCYRIFVKKDYPHYGIKELHDTLAHLYKRHRVAIDEHLFIIDELQRLTDYAALQGEVARWVR